MSVDLDWVMQKINEIKNHRRWVRTRPSKTER
jgi:hypothetical protein